MNVTQLLNEIWEKDERWMLWKDDGMVHLSNGGYIVSESTIEKLVRQVWMHYYSDNKLWKLRDDQLVNVRPDVIATLEQSLIEHEDVWKELADK